MLWELAHRRRDQEIANRVEVDAGTSHQAIEDVRARIPPTRSFSTFGSSGREEGHVKIPEALRLWWHDGAGARVLRYSGRQWTVLALVSFACTAASLIPVESMLGRGMLSVVPFMLLPAGLVTSGLAIAAAVHTRRFRRAQR